ncbi:hypothetical protein F5Y17DRAFT_436078 [Xylariaceae sp. FL0594]|nr:hypothetical protein F5Y17DRAFT_436078 [Xylariaceae sp. FL0594]
MMRKNAWEGTATTADRIMTDENGDYEDELSLPIVTSDVLQARQPGPKKAVSSLVAPSNQQTSTSTKTGPRLEHSPPGGTPSRPRMQLAVHIRSSPITPFTPINAPPRREISTVDSRPGRPRGRPPKSTASTRQPTPDALGTPEINVYEPRAGAASESRKRGRPKGWRPGMPYTTDPNSRYRKREARAAMSAAGTAADHVREPKRRGRPPRPLPSSVQEEYLKATPEYIPYKCEWSLPRPELGEPAICPAELQNFATLRRHVLLVHGDADPLICRFSRCRDHEPPQQFETEKQFRAHMENEHFAKYLWHRGEGYQNNGIWTLQQEIDKLPEYLFDEQGNQVTPWVRDQQLEDDLQRKQRKRRLKRLLYIQNENAPSEEEWTKQMLGID